MQNLNEKYKTENGYDYEMLDNKCETSLETNDVTTDFDWFIEKFYEFNPTATEEDLWKVLNKKHGVWYVNPDAFLDNNLTIPNGEVIGKFFVRKSKVAGQTEIGHIYALKGKKGKSKKYRLYKTLHATGIGIIPCSSGGYALLCRKKTSIFSIIFPIIFLIIIWKSYF